MAHINKKASNAETFQGNALVEHTGLEPVTSTLPVWRAPSCANAPLYILYFILFLIDFLKAGYTDPHRRTCIKEVQN